MSRFRDTQGLSAAVRGAACPGRVLGFFVLGVPTGSAVPPGGCEHKQRAAAGDHAAQRGQLGARQAALRAGYDH